MQNNIKNVVKLLFNKFGLELKRLPKVSVEVSQNKNAFLEQKRLFMHNEVKTIFDIGANIGQTVHKYHSLFPQAVIYSFEPFEEAFSVLLKTFKDNELIRTINLAIADETGFRRFYSTNVSRRYC